MKRTLLLSLLLLAACRHDEPAEAPRSLDAARQDYDEQRARFARSSALQSPVVAALLEDQSDVAVALQPELVKAVVEETAQRYLDRVVLDLDVNVQFQDQRDVHVNTFVGRVNAGTWRVAVTVPRIQGVLAAGKPTVDAPGGNRVQVRVPVSVREGRATARVKFDWNARSVAGVACRDFSVALDLEGSVAPDTYQVDGAFDLSAGPDAVRATPVFPPQPFRLRADLTPASWQRVRQALDEQDKLLKCGIGLDPDQMMPRLRALLDKGFDIRLPRSLFRAIELPGGIRQRVDAQGHTIEMEARTHALTMTPESIRYSADLTLRATLAPPPPSP